jgi:hypothetical protein
VDRVAAEQVVDVGERDAEVTGSRSCSCTSPRLTSHTRLWPVVVSSSRPSSPRKTRAVAPRVWKTPVMSGTRSRLATPTALASARAGLHSGPRKLKTVGTPSSAASAPRGGSRVERGREGEGDARLGEDLGDALRRQRQVDPESPQHIGGARRRTRRTVAVLDDRDAGRRGDDRRHRRHVDGAEPVTPGADDVEHVRGYRERQRRFEDRVAEPDDLVDRLPFARRARRNPPSCDGVARPAITCRIAHVDSDTLRSRRSRRAVRISGHE